MLITEAAIYHNDYGKSLHDLGDTSIMLVGMPIRYKIGVHHPDVKNYLLNYDKIVTYHITLFHKLLKH